MTLIPRTGQIAPGRIVAQPGDQILVDYTGSGAAEGVRAEADIDVSAPEIQGISVEPAF